MTMARNTSDEPSEIDAGSRMHVLDWLESPNFLGDLRGFVEPVGFTVAADATRQPKGRTDPRESVLVDRAASFLTAEQQDDLKRWWLVHPKGSKLPTWDLVVEARDQDGRKALVLVEAKAHATELNSAGKDKGVRDTAEQQARTDENHEQIGRAIAEASAALQRSIPGLNLSIAASYQFANRIAFAWKLASSGIPVALIYLGFHGDKGIAQAPFRLSSASDWQAAFDRHTAAHFPCAMQGKRIDCGAAPFWLLVRSLPSLRQSPPVEQRRAVV